MFLVLGFWPFLLFIFALVMSVNIGNETGILIFHETQEFVLYRNLNPWLEESVKTCMNFFSGYECHNYNV